MDQEVRDILLEQLKKLSKLDEKMVEPEQIVRIILAMVEIAKVL